MRNGGDFHLVPTPPLTLRQAQDERATALRQVFQSRLGGRGLVTTGDVADGMGEGELGEVGL